MENKIPYQFSNEKEFQEEIERCEQENYKTFHERKSKEPKATEEACKIFHNIMMDWYYDRTSK